MAEFSSYIGLDVHKETIAVAIADADGGAVRYQGEIPNTAAAVRRLTERLGRDGSAPRFCYEAGPAATRSIANSSPPGTPAQSSPRR